jgi:hypothetical protein
LDPRLRRDIQISNGEVTSEMRRPHGLHKHGIILAAQLLDIDMQVMSLDLRVQTVKQKDRFLLWNVDSRNGWAGWVSHYFPP